MEQNIVFCILLLLNATRRSSPLGVISTRCRYLWRMGMRSWGEMGAKWDNDAVIEAQVHDRDVEFLEGSRTTDAFPMSVT
jgi:hypothetical protein